MHIDYKKNIAEMLRHLALPQGTIVVLHVRLKGLMGIDNNPCSIDYQKISTDLLSIINDLYQPRGILVPTFTYSFLKTGIYDRSSTYSEVGRFGEVVRVSFPTKARTLNPVFNFVDCNGVLNGLEHNESTAFGEGSLWSYLSKIGHTCLNINVPGLFGTYLHYLEECHAVPYRYHKIFAGHVSADGNSWKDVNYEYYVRDLERDTRWRRDKISEFLKAHGTLQDIGTGQVPLRWFHSSDMDEVLGRAMQSDPEFLISDTPLNAKNKI